MNNMGKKDLMSYAKSDGLDQYVHPSNVYPQHMFLWRIRKYF